MRFRVALLAALVPLTSAATPRTVVVASGDCRDSELITAMNLFSSSLAQRQAEELASPEVVLGLLRPRPSRGLADLQRQVESARALFYSGKVERSVELINQTIIELEKVSPVLKPWPALMESFLVRGVAYKSQDRKDEAMDSFRRVLRVEPSHKLDPDYYPPSTIAMFEQVRKELVRGRRAALNVVSQPLGAEVYVEGRLAGTTPLKLDLPAGSYRVVVAVSELVSFPRSVLLPKDGQLSVDLPFEGALMPLAPLCLQTRKGDSGIAEKLAVALGLERVVLFWNEGGPGGQPYFKALVSSVEAGRQREAGVQARSGSDAAPIAELAKFVATGEGRVDLAGQPRPLGGAASPVVAPATSPGAPPQPTLSTAPNIEASGSSVRWSSARVTGVTLLISGIVLAGAGTGAFFAGAANRSRLQALQQPSGKLPEPTDSTHREALDLIPKVDANQVASFSLISVGVGAVVTGVLALIFFPGTEPASTTISFRPSFAGGGFGSVFGHF